MINLLRKFKLEILVFLLFVLVHLPDLGHDNFNTDVWKWKSRTYDFSTGIFTLKPELTIQKYHPGVTLMWLGTAGIKVANFYFDYVQLTHVTQIFVLDFIQKVFVVIGISIGLAMCFYVLRQLFDYKFALFAVALLALEPFYLGLSRVYHLEGLMSTFMLSSALWFYYYLQDDSKKYRLFISAFLGTLAILTKTSALYMIPFVGLSLLTHNQLKSRTFKKIFSYVFQNFSLWFFSFITFTLILWPALWAIPVKVFQVLYKGIFVIGIDTDHIQYFYGILVDDPGAIFYFVVLMYKSSVYLLLGLVLSLFFYRQFDTKAKRFLAFLLLFAGFYLIELTIPSKKLDRYVLPALMALSIISTYTLFYLVQKLKIGNVLKYTFVFLPVVAVMFYIHPDYLSYYNPMYGGLKKGIYVIEPKWMIGTNEIVEFFKVEQQKGKYFHSGVDESFEELINQGTAETVLSVGFPEKYYTQIWPFFREFGAWAVVKDLTPFASKTEFFVYPVWDDNSYEENRFGLEYYDTIKVRGVPVYNVYKRIKIWIM